MAEETPDAKDRLVEIAEKSNTTVEEIVKLVSKAMSSDIEFAKLQTKAAEKLKQMNKQNYELLKAQNDYWQAQLLNKELSEKMKLLFPPEKREIAKPPAPTIEGPKSTILGMDGQPIM